MRVHFGGQGEEMNARTPAGLSRFVGGGTEPAPAHGVGALLRYAD
jgi:hypothetical protein